MLTQSGKTNRQIIDYYTDQPSALPSWPREKISGLWGGSAVQFYALADLDKSLNLAHTWIVLSEEQVTLAHTDGDGKCLELRSFERSRVKATHQRIGLSCMVLSLDGPDGQAPLAQLRYTHRQRRSMETLKYILDQQINGQQTPVTDADDVYASAVSQSIQEAQASVAGNRLAVIWRLVAYMKPYRKQLAFGMTAAIMFTVLSMTPAYLTGRWLIGRIVEPVAAGEITPQAAMRLGTIILVVLAGVYLLRTFCAWVRLRTMAKIGEYVARDLRDDLYAHLHRLSLSYFSKKQTGSIIGRVSSDTDRLWDFVAFGIIEVSLAVAMLIGLSCVLIYMDWRLGLVMIIPLPALMWTIYNHGRRMKRTFTRIWRKWSDMMAVLSDTIPGIKVVKSFNREDYEKQRFCRRNDAVLDECLNVHVQWTRFWPLLSLSFHTLAMLVWIFALPRLVGTSGATLTLGTFVSFLLYMGMFVAPVETIGMLARMLNRATTSAHRVFEVLDTKPTVRDVPDAVRLDPLAGQVTFENVSFAYDQVRLIIKGIDFDVQPGEMIGLVGPSGAGKTTIINLIARFYDPTGGRILIDGVDLKELDASYYRRQIGIVQQDPYLFHGTVLENIRYGQPTATTEQIIEAARAANAHSFICELPQGYDTIVGERGHTLSGGERQRVSIARALLCDPRILILDEATSSVDTETEQKIQEALDRLIPGRTTFAIAHRLSTLRRATRLLVIEDGRITEEGAHADLLQKEDGKYKKMYET